MVPRTTKRSAAPIPAPRARMRPGCVYIDRKMSIIGKLHKKKTNEVLSLIWSRIRSAGNYSHNSYLYVMHAVLRTHLEYVDPRCFLAGIRINTFQAYSCKCHSIYPEACTHQYLTRNKIKVESFIYSQTDYELFFFVPNCSSSLVFLGKIWTPIVQNKYKCTTKIYIFIHGWLKETDSMS